MKMALVTTTINVPEVLALYDRINTSDARFFVAGDKKTPPDALDFCEGLDNVTYLGVGRQAKYLGWTCSEFIGWNTDSRRNIAVLEALKWGAEVIISIDDDMIPCEHFSWQFQNLFDLPYEGIQFGHPGSWFDAGLFTIPPAPQRGLPAQMESVLQPSFVMDAKIGAAQGIILGTPDTDAMTAISKEPYVLGATDILRNGFVVHPQAYAVFNSQITAFHRDLAPAFMQHYASQGRNTDIFASLLMRRVMQERGLYTYFGPPFGFHARRPRPLIKDLKAEMYGLENIEAYAECLAGTNLGSGSVVTQCRQLMGALHEAKLLPNATIECAFAFYDDCEGVL